jgi:hypothetical protein
MIQNELYSRKIQGNIRYSYILYYAASEFNSLQKYMWNLWKAKPRPIQWDHSQADLIIFGRTVPLKL